MSNNFSTGQSWGALRKSWKGYRIAIVQGDNGKMREYAAKIRKLQSELASFLNIASSNRLDAFFFHVSGNCQLYGITVIPS